MEAQDKACLWKGCRKATPLILDIGNLSVQKVAIGSSHYAVLFNCGKLLLFADNQHGQLGVGDNFSTSAEPMPGHFFVDVACGKDHTASVKKDGSVICWGSNLLMQCGSSHKKDFLAPHVVDFKQSEETKIIQVGCGHHHTLALSESGVVWSWGSGVQLGLGKIRNSHIPSQIESLKQRKVLSIACGAFHSLALVSSEISSSANQLTKKFDDFTTEDLGFNLVKENENYSKDNKWRLTNSHSLSDVQNAHIPTINSSTSLTHKFDLELKSCPCPVIQTIQETPDQAPGHFLPRSPISELMMENEDETSFVDFCDLKEADVQSVCLLDNSSDVMSDLISLEDIPSNFVHRPIDEISNDDVQMMHQLNLDLDAKSTFSSTESTNGKTSFLREKQDDSNTSGWNYIPNTRSSFLDEFKAKEFLQKQLECINPLVPESLPSYGTSIQSKFESASSAVKMLTSNDPLSKKFETLLQHVPSPPGAVQEYVSQLTRTVVSNIKTSVDKIVSTAPIEAITEGVSGGVMEVVKMAKRKSFGEHSGMKETSAADIMHLCVKNSTLNRCEAVSKSTSMNPIDVEKQTHHRNVSLPTGTLESFPDVFRHESRVICWDTEVWSWGQGSRGQLGLGDTMDRDSPTLMTFLSHEHISQVDTGHSHNVALSHSGQVFVWGDNNNNQLGQQNIGLLSCPLIIQLEGGLPCWSVAAGDKHTLIACDGLDNSTQVFYCGFDPSCSKDKLTHVKQMMSIGELKSMGVVQEIYGGGDMSSCLMREFKVNDVVRNAVLDLSSSERFFCLALKRIIASFLQPLIQKLDVSECNGLVVGKAKTEGLEFNPHWSQCFRLLFSKLSCLQQIVARNQCDLKHWLRLQSSDPRSIPFIRDSEKFVNAYASYFKAYCDAVSCLCFKSCVHSNKDFFDLISDDFLTFLEGDKFSTTDPSVNLQNLVRLPFFRLREYQKALDRMAEHYPAYTSVHADLQRVLQMWRKMRQSSDNDLTTASITAAYWKSSNPKLLEALQPVPSRRLVRDGKVFPLTLNSGGGNRLFSWSTFVLFNDYFVQIQYSNHIVFPLQVIWLEISPDSKALKNVITLTMPEELLVLTTQTHSEKAEWVWCLQQSIKSSLSTSSSSSSMDHHHNHQKKKIKESHHLGPPIERHATYTFQKSGWLKDATYTGQWRNALMHGKGELKWTSGRKYMGSFVGGQMEGHGTMSTPREVGMEVQDGTWKAGQLFGYGVIRYANGDVYRGYFVDGKRHGHGIMKQGKFTTISASIYYGQWSNDKRSGYGVFDDIPRGQKYMGQWFEDNRHGSGLVVTLDGYYFEGSFTNGKMAGRGLFMTDDNHCYEGDFSGFAFSGKGTLRFPNGDFIEGSFGGNFSDGVKINGTLRKGFEVHDPEGHDTKHGQNIFSHQSLPSSFGKMSFPAEEKWEELYRQCYFAIGCTKNVVEDDCSEVWRKVASYMTHSSEIKSPILKRMMPDDDDMNVIPNFSQLNLTYPVWKSIKSYLTKAFEHPNHPLGFLLSSLVDVYLATYVGVNAHVRLLTHATLELKAYVENIYSVLRHLFPKLPMTTCLLPVTDDMIECNELYKSNRFRATPQALLHPIIIPKVYPALFNLFVIHNEKNDEKYWRRASLWNKQSDQTLMTYLDVDRKYRPSADSLLDCENIFNNNKQCYQEAIERLQRISTSLSPFEKMLQIHASFHELNVAVQKSLGMCPQWSMDELFPVFWFVVVRSRIQHLGAEIHFIEELVDRHHENGELGLMFTTLKACYFQILNEKLA